MVADRKRIAICIEADFLDVRERRKALLSTPRSDARARETGDVDFHLPGGRRLQTCATGVVTQGFIAS